MVQYEIKDVVCDYGIYEDGELKLILNSAHNAHLIKRILEIDVSVPNSATPADFVEVKHGEWLVKTRSSGSSIKCSECGHREDRGPAWNIAWGISNYCPNCGAKMDGERKQK